MEDERKILGRELAIIGLISSVHFFSHFYYIALQPLFLLIQSEIGLNFTQLGLIVTVFAFTSAVGHYPGGVLVDRYGPRYFLIGGLIISSLTIIAMGFAPNYPTMLVLAALIGAADSVVHPADYAILSDRISEKRLGRAFSFHTFIGFFGFAVAPVVVVFLASVWDWRMALSISGLAGLLTAVIVALKRDLLPVLDTQARVEQASAAKEKGAGALSMLLSAPIIMMFMFYAVGSIGTSGIKDFSTVALVSFYDAAQNEAVRGVAGFMLGTAIGVLAGGVVADRFGRINLIATIGYLLASLAVVVIAMKWLPLWAAIGGYFVAGFTTGMIMPSRDLLVKAVTPPGAMGKAFGLVTSGYGFGGAISPLLFGMLMDQGMVPMVIAAPAFFLVVAIAFALAASHMGRRHRAPQPAQ